ncbi:MAG TPA: copper resistance protein B [Allosphingosinicella sp.]|jgi:copper resistance protein B
MKRLLILLAATAFSTPALAQHHGHHPAPAPKAKPKAKPKAAPRKPAAKAKPARRGPAAVKPVGRPAADPHAGHTMPAAPEPADPHAGHQMPAEPRDPHAGHQMPAEPQDPHAGHQMPAAGLPAPPVVPPPAAAMSGPEHAADAVFGSEAMAAARAAMNGEHGSMRHSKILIDRVEARSRRGRDGYLWDAQGWYGGDIHKLWLKTEGEGDFGRSPQQAEVQALWSRAIDPWFDLQLGVRHDFRPDPERTHLVLGIQGLAPYWFEVDAAAFLSSKGDVTARIEAEYDLRLTQKLILQPRAELNLAMQDIPEIGIGSGISSGEFGARLRYEIRPEFAPFVGVEYERSFGKTADYERAAARRHGHLNLLVGVRAWF